MDNVHRHKVAFHLTRKEPAACVPLLNGEPRNQTYHAAKDENAYANLCESAVAPWSHDAFAFSGMVSDAVLEKLNFPPNRLGAENLLSCRMAHAGYSLSFFTIIAATTEHTKVVG